MSDSSPWTLQVTGEKSHEECWDGRQREKTRKVKFIRQLVRCGSGKPWPVINYLPLCITIEQEPCKKQLALWSPSIFLCLRVWVAGSSEQWGFSVQSRWEPWMIFFYFTPSTVWLCNWLVLLFLHTVCWWVHHSTTIFAQAQHQWRLREVSSPRPNSLLANNSDRLRPLWTFTTGTLNPWPPASSNTWLWINEGNN